MNKNWFDNDWRKKEKLKLKKNFQNFDNKKKNQINCKIKRIYWNKIRNWIIIKKEFSKKIQ